MDSRLRGNDELRILASRPFVKLTSRRGRRRNCSRRLSSLWCPMLDLQLVHLHAIAKSEVGDSRPPHRPVAAVVHAHDEFITRAGGPVLPLAAPDRADKRALGCWLSAEWDRHHEPDRRRGSGAIRRCRTRLLSFANRLDRAAILAPHDDAHTGIPHGFGASLRLGRIRGRNRENRRDSGKLASHSVYSGIAWRT